MLNIVSIFSIIAIVSGSISNQKKQQTLSIVLVANINGSVYPLNNLCSKGIELALENVKKVASNLAKYDFKIDILDDMCTRQLSVGKFVNAMLQNDDAQGRLPLTLGGFCTGNYFTGQLMQHFNIVGISPVGMTPEIHRFRQRFRNFFVMSSRADVSYTTLAYFFKLMGWLKYAIVGEQSDFFSDLENMFIRTMDQANGSKLLGVARYPYTSGTLPESDHVQQAVYEISQLDARIILVDATSASRASCWLHRYGMFGPNYALFFFSAYAYLPTDVFRFRPWCTEAMLTEVLQSTFYFGPTTYANLYGENAAVAADSSGFTGRQLDDALIASIDGATMAPTWWFWRSLCYDSVLTTGYLLDVAEAKLRQHNSTLSEWTVDGFKYKQNSDFILKLLKESLFEIRIRTQMTEVAFNSSTLANTDRTSPSAIFQIQGQNLSIVPIGIFDENGGSPGPGKLLWRTRSGKAPYDGFRTILALSPQYPEAIYWIMIVSSAAQIVDVFVIAIFFFVYRRQKEVANSVPQVNVYILVGNVLLSISTLSQPFESHASVHINCMVSFGFLFVGLAALFYGIFAKLTLTTILLMREHHDKMQEEQRAKKRRIYRSATEKPHKPPISHETNVKIFSRIGSFYVGMTLVLTCAMFTVDPMHSEMLKGTLLTSADDESLQIQQFAHECLFGTSTVSEAIRIFIVVSYGTFILRSCFMAYAIRHKHYEQVNDSRQIANAVYVLTLLFGAGALIAGAIFQNLPVHRRLAINFTLIASISLNLYTVFIPKVVTLYKQRKSGEQAAATAGANHHLH